MSSPGSRCDVCIVGAGMAGLTLARQIQLRLAASGRPAMNIVLVEHRTFPMPEAAHKVGESTVEIAAHYLAQTLQLAQHLEQEQLPKFGLRLFFRGSQPIGNDLGRYDEIGASRVLPIPTYQIDRGRFENHLAQTCVAAGAHLMDGTTLRKLQLNKGAHVLRLRNHGGEHTLTCRYLIDASGRRAWLRGQCELDRSVRHGNHAVWARIGGHLPIDEWSRDRQWRERCGGTPRHLSTNHFCGPGYWLWLIPLSSGATSVGVVFDPKIVAAENLSSYEKLLAWIAVEHPLVAQHMADHPVIDFRRLKNYASNVSRTWSEDGWLLSGDAGTFSDPFYSPGADFIAFANTYITELVTTDADPARYEAFQQHFFSFFANTLSLYRGQYGGFGNRDLMLVKTIWDFTYYWAVLSKLFFSGRFTDLDFLRETRPALSRSAALNSGLQRAFRDLSRSGGRVGGGGGFYDYHSVPLFHRLKLDLLAGDAPDAAGQLEDSVQVLEQVASSLHGLLEDHVAGRNLPTLDKLGQMSAFA